MPSAEKSSPIQCLESAWCDVWMCGRLCTQAGQSLRECKGMGRMARGLLLLPVFGGNPGGVWPGMAER